MDQVAFELVEAQYLRLEKTLRDSGSTINYAKLRQAYEYARDAHGNQLRKDGTPFITHPLAVAEIVAEMNLDEASLLAAILHDCIEDTPVTHEDISKLFSEEVATLVEGVTKLTRVVYTSKEDEQMENLRKMLMAMVKDIRVILIKISDRLHNMRTMDYQSERKQLEKAAETMDVYAPIAHRLGMQKVKWELEDLSLLYLDPIGYKEIMDGLAERQSVSNEFFQHTQTSITERLESAGIQSSVSGRVKHVYSIYRKMYGQNKQLSEVLDLYAFRVIVDSIADCYNVLGYIHEMYRPIPGRFKDYIGTPKPNRYQSLHTTVIGTEGLPFEVQIRTWDMHHTAEYGIAAHWKYKEGITESRQSDEETFAWIRQLLEAQQYSDAQDFFQSIKVDMFADEVFVFTPKGDVKNLPAGATPIDYAYSIHTAVGNSMTGAKVNGRMVPFNHVLQNGDIVEVLTSKSARGPSRDWLNMVVSSEARNKIRQWFKKEKREENVFHGKAAFLDELKRTNITLTDITDEAVLPHILETLSFSSLDDMYASIGFGGSSALKMVNRIREELRLMEKEESAALRDSLDLDWSAKIQPAKGMHGIVVEGIDNCLVKFARCCMPVPGDAIVGFITRGYGISIHRNDCRNHQSADDPNRWIRVAWAVDGKEAYQTGISIQASNRDGLIMDVTTVLSSLKVKVTAINARDTGDGFAAIHLTLAVSNLKELNTAISRLNGISGILEVNRVGMESVR